MKNHTLKKLQLYSWPQTQGEKKETKKGISDLNLTTSKSLWSTFLLVLQGKIIFPFGIERETTSVV